MTEKVELLVATNNEGKMRELNALLAELPLKLRKLSELPLISEAEETGDTFTQNAVLKARHYCSQSGLWTMADDSGLEVEALGGAPGVYSARYGGREISYAERVGQRVWGATADCLGETTRGLALFEFARQNAAQSRPTAEMDGRGREQAIADQAHATPCAQARLRSITNYWRRTRA
ncbi:MAG: hypothetical protein LC802_11335 [Acidobacteria bacterium]|nr:hypothetical protein [Acidobacteriota bacterium]